MKIGFQFDRCTAFGDLYSSTISNKLSLNQCHFKGCHSARSQLYPRSKICKIIQHTDKSVARHHHSFARMRDTMKYLRLSDMQGWSWSTHFSVFHMSATEIWLVRQPCQCLEIFRFVENFRCIWFNFWYVGLNKPPILVSIAYFHTSADIW